MSARTPTPFEWARDVFARARNPAAGKPLAGIGPAYSVRNTRVYKRAEECYAVRFHETDVVTLWQDGRVTLDSGGWHTISTKDRINAYAPLVIYSEAGAWYVSHDKARASAERKARREFDIPATGELWDVAPEGFDHRAFRRRVAELSRVPFFDGITFDKRGRCLNGISPDAWQRFRSEQDATKKRIQKYCTEFNRALAHDGLPMPGSGDCILCAGEIDDAGHLLSHVEEGYYVPSLAVNALRADGYRDQAIYYLLAMDSESQTMGGPGSRYRASDGSHGGNPVRRALRKYLCKRLLQDAPTITTTEV